MAGMKPFNLRQFGWVLLALGIAAEVLAIVARHASRDHVTRGFTRMVSSEIVASMVIIVIGALLISLGKPKP
jgi:uncharacterized membrane protein YidH (DUF202 family)